MDVHERLRLARVKAGIDLRALEHRTGVRLRLLELVDEGRFGELPSGLYARAAVRAYAAAVGCDAAEILEAVKDRLPAAEDPLDGIARVRGWERPQPPPAAAPPARPVQPSPPQEAPLCWRTGAAAAIDGLLLAALAGVVLKATALACGRPVGEVLEFATPAILVLVTVIVGLYFLILGGLGGATAGVLVTGAPMPEWPRALSVRMVASRAARFLIAESSVLVELLLGIRRLPISAGIPSGFRMRRREAGQASAR